MNLTDIKRKIIELNYELLLAMRYDDDLKVKEIRLETNKLINQYLNKLKNMANVAVEKKKE